jgi:hypothetical protein
MSALGRLRAARRAITRAVVEIQVTCPHDVARVREAYPEQDAYGDYAPPMRVCLDCGLAERGDVHVLLSGDREAVRSIGWGECVRAAEGRVWTWAETREVAVGGTTVAELLRGGAS